MRVLKVNKEVGGATKYWKKVALFLFVEVSHCKHLGEKQPRRRVMKNLFEMCYMTHSLAQFPSGFCAELSLCPKATGVEFETTKDCHSYYYWSGIVSQANMELSSGRNEIVKDLRLTGSRVRTLSLAWEIPSGQQVIHPLALGFLVALILGH
jgi:hypothetical protein